MSLIRLGRLAENLLERLVDTAATEQVLLPERRCLVPGLAGTEAWDCEQVTVGLVQLDPLNASRPGGQVGSSVTVPGRVGLPTAVLRVEIVRAVTVLDENGVSPPAAAIHDDGLIAMQDAALLHRLRTRLMVEGLASSSETAEEPTDIRLDGIGVTGPEGGLSGVYLTVGVTVV